MTVLASPEHSAAASRRRRHIRTTITMLLAIALLIGAGYVAWDVLTGGRKDATVNTAACATSPPTRARAAFKPVPARQIRVNVYNANGRSGLAGSVAEALRARGVKVDEVANDPARRKVPDTAHLRHGKAGRRAALTLRGHFPGAVLVADKRKGAVVDVVLGQKFERIATVAQARAALRPGRRATPVPTC